MEELNKVEVEFMTEEQEMEYLIEVSNESKRVN
jgi:hypothetical protein